MPVLLSSNLPKLANGDMGNSSLPATELLSHSSYHASGLQYCFPPRTRKYCKKVERDSLIREATRRVQKKCTRKQNVVQSQEVTFVLNSAGAG